MKILFHERFLERYSRDPAAEEGRLDGMLALARERHEVVAPEPADARDVLRVHSRRHFDEIRSERRVFPVALLAAGAAVAAAESAMNGEPAFALLRPPGHHASPDSCWGVCFFNNVAVALARLLDRGAVRSAFVLDFDLHHGDGTQNAFAGDPRVRYSHPEAPGRAAFVERAGLELREASPFDVLAVSAGFDRFAEDWGAMLALDDYRALGAMSRDAARERCRGRRFGVLEGGYNHARLADCLSAFLDGFDDQP
ncbi:MAG: histone deacetylase family protein [Deltaproteobacteria bacterium]|nr:histone deacetylase family protein [Deltaproteobacteria bacterium]